MKVAVIGAGNGGQAMAGYLATSGHNVVVYNRNPEVINRLNAKGSITLCGCIQGEGTPTEFTSDLKKAIYGAAVIMITTTAIAHREIAWAITPFLEENQIIVLNPGRTGGALEFRNIISKAGCDKRVYVAETQTLVYACRIITTGIVNIIGIKDVVYVSAYPASDTGHVVKILKELYSCFTEAPNILYTSLGNVGAIFHPCVLLFNAATVERRDEFYFYRDMTEQVGRFIELFDAERLAVGKAYGIDLPSVSEWISETYPDTNGNTLCEKMKNNPAYYEIKSPTSIYTRQLMEDIPTGVLPIAELGKVAGVDVHLHESLLSIIGSLLNVDFRKNGRTLSNLGLNGKSKDEIIELLTK